MTYSQFNVPKSMEHPIPASSSFDIPLYLSNVYQWAYINPRSIRFLDRMAIVNFILWGQADVLMKSVTVALNPGDQVFQAASVYGHFSQMLCDKLGFAGHLTCMDIVPMQLERLESKLADHYNFSCVIGDLSQPSAFHTLGSFDKVVCFFLLHEVPEVMRRPILQNCIDLLPVNGQLIVVDYHRPVWYHPVRPIMAAIFSLLEPFATSLIQKPISSLVDPAQARLVSSQYFFGGLYQKLIFSKM